MQLQRLRGRFLLGFVAGGAMGLALPNYERVAQAARTSLDSLQTQVNQIISGAQPVGAVDAADVNGLEAILATFVQSGDDAVLNSVSVADDVLADRVEANSVQVGFTSSVASPATAGTIRWNSATARLEVSDGSAWRALQYAPLGP